MLEESPGGPYVVGYYPDDPSKPKEEFKDAALACATYVKFELAYIRKAVEERVEWTFTTVGVLHPSLVGCLSLADGELVICVTLLPFGTSESA
jgi:hypothetical protein